MRKLIENKSKPEKKYQLAFIVHCTDFIVYSGTNNHFAFWVHQYYFRLMNLQIEELVGAAV